MASTRTPSSLTTRRAICSRTSNSTARRAGTPWRRRRCAGAGGGTCARSCRPTRTTRRSRGHCARSFTSSEGNDDADCGPLETGRPEGLRYRRDRCVCPRSAAGADRHAAPSGPAPTARRCRHRPPNGVPDQPARPRRARRHAFSGNSRRTARGVMQSAYEIRVAASERDLARKGGTLWDSGRVASDQSTGVVYAGPALQSARRYFWQVRVWDETGARRSGARPPGGRWGCWRRPTGRRSWIEPATCPRTSASRRRRPMLRREFTLDGDVVSARAYVTSHGLYELYLNGRRVGDQLFTPGLDQLQQAPAVPDLRRHDAPEDGAERRWRHSRQRLVSRRDSASRGKRNIYGDRRRAARADRRDATPDGRHQVIASDGKWKPSTGPILASEIYLGETYDARLEQPGMGRRSGSTTTGWTPVTVVEHSHGRPDRARRPAGPAHRRDPAGQDPASRPAATPSSTSARTWSAGCG